MVGYNFIKITLKFPLLDGETETHIEGETSKSRQERQRQRRALSSSIIRDLHEQYTDAPTEIRVR